MYIARTKKRQWEGKVTGHQIENRKAKDVLISKEKYMALGRGHRYGAVC